MLSLLRDTVAGSYPPKDLKEPAELNLVFELTAVEDEERFADADWHIVQEIF